MLATLAPRQSSHNTLAVVATKKAASGAGAPAPLFPFAGGGRGLGGWSSSVGPLKWVFLAARPSRPSRLGRAIKIPFCLPRVSRSGSPAPSPLTPLPFAPFGRCPAGGVPSLLGGCVVSPPCWGVGSGSGGGGAWLCVRRGPRALWARPAAQGRLRSRPRPPLRYQGWVAFLLGLCVCAPLSPWALLLALGWRVVCAAPPPRGLSCVCDCSVAA